MHSVNVVLYSSSCVQHLQCCGVTNLQFCCVYTINVRQHVHILFVHVLAVHPGL